MVEQLGLQIETIEAIIVSLVTAFLGTGTVAMIAKVALSNLTKTMASKVKEAEAQNQISSDQASKTISLLNASNEILKAQVDTLQTSINKLVESQVYTADKFQALMDEYKARDEKIKDLIIKEFGEEIE